MLPDSWDIPVETFRIIDGSIASLTRGTVAFGCNMLPEAGKIVLAEAIIILKVVAPASWIWDWRAALIFEVFVDAVMKDLPDISVGVLANVGGTNT